MDELIHAVFRALQKGSTIEAIHQAILKTGWDEEEAFLAIKAGENLYQAVVQQEKELAAKPLPFGRKS
jgi:hypothetical protein